MPELLSDFAALKLITSLVLEMRTRAGKGYFDPKRPESKHYMQACRIIAAELGSSFLLVYEDMREKGLEVPLACTYSLHFGQQTLPDSFLKPMLAQGGRKLIDAPGRHQNLSMARTCYGSHFEEAWCRTQRGPANEEQFHAYLFVQPDLTSGRWKPVLPDEAWCRRQGMRRLPEFFS